MAIFSKRTPERYSSKPGLKAYFNEIKNFQVLTKEEEQQLFSIIAPYSGEILDLEEQLDCLAAQIQKELDDKLMIELEASLARVKVRLAELWSIIGPTFQEIARRNQKLVAKMAIKHKGAFPLEEIICAANEGLRKAMLMFKPEKGNKFSTYAVWWIRQCIKREKQLNKTVHIPVNISEKQSSISQYEANWISLTGEVPSDEELAAIIIVNESQVAEAKKAFLSKHPEITNQGSLYKNREYLQIRNDLRRVQQEARKRLAEKQLEAIGIEKPSKRQVYDQDTANFIKAIKKLALQLEKESTKKGPKSKDLKRLTPSNIHDIRSTKANSAVIRGESINEEGEVSYSHIDASTSAQERIPSPEQQVALKEIQAIVRKSLRFLSIFERKVITLRFGLEEADERTLQEIGDDSELSKERIRQIEESALKKLRAHMKTDSKTQRAISAYFS